jgi:hypothetical protein
MILSDDEYYVALSLHKIEALMNHQQGFVDGIGSNF